MIGAVAVFGIIALVATFFTDLFSIRQSANFWRIAFFVISTLLLVLWYYAARH